jgi:hypothetical protein
MIRIAAFFQLANLIAFELEEEMANIDTFGSRFSVGKPTVSRTAQTWGRCLEPFR